MVQRGRPAYLPTEGHRGPAVGRRLQEHDRKGSQSLNFEATDRDQSDEGTWLEQVLVGEHDRVTGGGHLKPVQLHPVVEPLDHDVTKT